MFKIIKNVYTVKHNMKEKTPKQRIVTAAIDLMLERGDMTRVTIRDIASRAGVGIGLVNYHFQTKENLINQSVRQFIGEKVIAVWDEEAETEGMSSADSLKAMLKSAAGFLADYPGISRISILFDLTNPSPEDNSMQTIRGLLPILRSALEAVYDQSVGEQEIVKTAWQIVAAIHESFLRAALLKEETGVDFFDPPSRDAYIESMVDKLLDFGPEGNELEWIKNRLPLDR